MLERHRGKRNTVVRPRFAPTFGLLVLGQAAHSIEEYIGRLWVSFPPARALSGLVSADREFGFLVINIVLVTCGAWCYFWPVRRGWRSASAIALGWALVEVINGVGHPFWAVRQGAYTPGVATAPILLVLAIMMISQIRGARRIAVS